MLGVGYCAEQRRLDHVARIGKIDSLKSANVALKTRNAILQAERSQLIVSRDKARQERDSIKRVSDAATEQLKKARASLPPASTVPDSLLRQSYTEAIRQLDAAFLELARKDAIIRQDSLDRLQSDSIEAQYKAEIANLQEMVANANATAEEWKTLYEDEKNQWCGRKCGMVIGAVGTVVVVVVTAVVLSAGTP